MRSGPTVNIGNPIVIASAEPLDRIEDAVHPAEVPLGPGPERKGPARHPSAMGAIAGFFKGAVAAVLLGAIATSAMAQDVQKTTTTITPIKSEIIGTIHPGETPAAAAMELDHQYGKLDELLREGRITPSEMANARRLLKAALIDRNPSVVLPLDTRGRIDVLTLARLGTTTPEGRTRGELAFSNLTRDLESRMRVTARDMTDPNVRFIDGAPGYKEISAQEVRELVLDALREVPLGELPGGKHLASMVRLLPNMADVDAEHLSARELEKIIPDRERAWFKARFGSTIEGHEVEASVLAFAAVTGLRAGSPGAAKFIDDLGVRIRLFKSHTDDGRFYTKGTMVYRDRHIFPDLDVETGARHVAGNTTLRATVTGTIAPEADRDQMVRGYATVGARYSADRLWLDSAVTYFIPEDRLTATIRGGYFTVNEWSITGGVNSTFGKGVALGDANGRIGAEIDVAKDFKWKGNEGNFGVFLGAAADTDGKNDDVRAGVFFRLSW